jgi:hypothetical protein
MANAETKTCQNCKNQFTIEPDDFAFYEKIAVPPPTFCPPCRLTRRFLFRNERALYKRKCGLCGQDKIMVFAPDNPHAAYCKECWWSDNWDAKTYGREYDFSRPFFEQFRDLYRVVPRVGIIQQGQNPGSEYANRVTDARNCYLLYGSTRPEFCRYGVFVNDSKECLDCYNIAKSEQCYECLDCVQCYNLLYSQECTECSNSQYLLNCRNCENCFGCVNLRNKSYCIFNQQYTKEEYAKKIADMNLGDVASRARAAAQFAELAKKFIAPNIVSHHAVNVSGNWISAAKNTRASFSCRNTENVSHCFSVFDGKDGMDHCFWGNGTELMYECNSVGNQCGRIAFTSESWDNLFDAQYSSNCHSSQYLFGCIGIRKSQYCILNKQYTKEEYEALIPRIKEHMNQMPYRDKRGLEYRYGEFFPAELGPFAYNESIAQDFFPLTKEEALARGFLWKDAEARSYNITLAAEYVPSAIAGAQDSVTTETIGCAHAGTCGQQCTVAFKILADDLAFYRRANVPLPRLCPNCRHYERMKLRNPLLLWPRACQCAGAMSDNGVYANTTTHAHGTEHCPNKFETSYAPEKPKVVYCEQCYNAEVV